MGGEGALLEMLIRVAAMEKTIAKAGERHHVDKEFFERRMEAKCR